MSKLSKSLGFDSKKLLTRSFEFNGQNFRVKVPLAVEAEEMYKKVENPPEDRVEAKFQEITKELYEKRDSLEELKENVKFTENDILINDKSMREMAKIQVSTEIRIVESIKLLIPVDNTDLSDITYSDIELEFPLPVQLQLVKRIAEVISPNYEENKKN